MSVGNDVTSGYESTHGFQVRAAAKNDTNELVVFKLASFRHPRDPFDEAALKASFDAAKAATNAKVRVGQQVDWLRAVALSLLYLVKLIPSHCQSKPSLTPRARDADDVAMLLAEGLSSGKKK